MAGIYLHIPFCRKACTYCDFHFSTNLSAKLEMAKAIAKELEMEASFFKEGEEIQTLYFGGGTPSLLDEAELGVIMEAIHQNYKVNPDAEVSLECNPDDLNPTKLGELRKAGINRLSIGIQSFREEDLRLMNRSHSAAQSISSVKMAQDAGFDNLTIDLIYGLPNLKSEEWEANLEQVLSLKVPHISAYALTVEEKTALAHLVKKGKVELPDDYEYEKQYMAMVNRLAKAGFDHYEISNFALPGHRSQHNSSYWKGKPYLGVGPSAHSFRGDIRRWNVSNNAKYLRAIQKGETTIADEEQLTKRDLLNEYLMTHLRMREGLDLEKIQTEFGFDLMELEGDQLRSFMEKAWMERSGMRIFLTEKGKLVSDKVIRELFQLGD